jgi:Predicted metal-dependent enzyme
MRRRLTRWPARLAPHLLFLIPELLMAAGPFVITATARTDARPRFRMPDFFYGGQALIEGVMMRGRTTVAMSVRPPSGEIRTYSEALPAALTRGRWLKLPFVRGVLVLYEALVIGTRMLMRSAAIAAEGEDVQIGKGTLAVTMIVSLGLAVGLFFVLPLFLSTFAQRATESDMLANLAEGGIRLAIFVAYISLVGMTAEIRRVFAYHGAEHKAISAHEARRPLTPDEVDRFSTAHTRCGTTFLLIVVVISIFFFGLIPRAGVPLPLLFLSRIVLVPVIAGVAYELVRFGASHYGSRLVRALYAPGLWLQALTTRPPDHSMLEVSIASLESCLASDRAASAPASPNR